MYRLAPGELQPGPGQTRWFEPSSLGRKTASEGSREATRRRNFKAASRRLVTVSAPSAPHSHVKTQSLHRRTRPRLLLRACLLAAAFNRVKNCTASFATTRFISHAGTTPPASICCAMASWCSIGAIIPITLRKRLKKGQPLKQRSGKRSRKPKERPSATSRKSGTRNVKVLLESNLTAWKTKLHEPLGRKTYFPLPALNVCIG